MSDETQKLNNNNGNNNKDDKGGKNNNEEEVDERGCCQKCCDGYSACIIAICKCREFSLRVFAMGISDYYCACELLIFSSFIFIWFIWDIT